MSKSLFFLLCLALPFCSFGQEKVDWVVSYDSEESVVTFTATLEDGWHVYSQHINEGIGPVATSFSFEPNACYKLIGKTSEPTPITKYDPNFEGELSFFEHSVEFSQRLKVKSTGEVRGKITYMVCNDSKCLPPTDVDFNLMINKNEK